jgi:hypothetical protein
MRAWCSGSTPSSQGGNAGSIPGCPLHVTVVLAVSTSARHAGSAGSNPVGHSQGALGQLAEPPGPDPGCSGFESQGRYRGE